MYILIAAYNVYVIDECRWKSTSKTHHPKVGCFQISSTGFKGCMKTLFMKELKDYI